MDVNFSPGPLIELPAGRRLDSVELRRLMLTRAAHLRQRGLGRGDRVLIHYGNNSAFFIDLLACWWLGACVVPIDARLSAFEVEILTRAARPRLSLVDAATDGGHRASLEIAGVTLVEAEDSESGDGAYPASPMGMDDPALILFTSGTTGSPKGVVHTHRTLRARLLALRYALGMQPYRRALCLLPTHFGHGLICNCLFPWLNGAELYILPPFRPELIVDLGRFIDDNAITFLSSVPTVWTLALKMARPPQGRSLRRVHCGSAPLSAHLWRGVQEWTGTREVLNTYGITETASWVAGSNLRGLVPQDGLIGVGWGAEIAVLRTNSTEAMASPDERCQPGEQGYIWLSTPSLMTGYFEREDLTAKVVRQGWFMTGDIGVLDERGHLYLRGREREEINKGGLKVYPGDVDSIASAFPAVTDVCTFAVEDPLYGQDVGIALVLADSPDRALPELRAFMRARLAKHQMPAQWFVVDAIPRTSRGKINRELVARSCVASLSPMTKERRTVS